MEFLELAQTRYSVRKYAERKVDDELLEKILSAGHVAPTACNKQPQRILVINNAQSLARLRECTQCSYNAPAAFLICYDKDECWRRDTDGKTSGEIDASIVTAHMMLEATSLGLGTTWVMSFDPQVIKKTFNVPQNYETVSLLLVGYPDQTAKPAPWHNEFKLEREIVSYNKF